MYQPNRSHISVAKKTGIMEGCFDEKVCESFFFIDIPLVLLRSRCIANVRHFYDSCQETRTSFVSGEQFVWYKFRSFKKTVKMPAIVLH